MSRRLPVRALALALALAATAAATAAGVDAGGEKFPDCRLFDHFALSNNPGLFPACSLIKNGKLLRVNLAPGEPRPFTGQSFSAIDMFDLSRVNRADVPNGLSDLFVAPDIFKLDFERHIDKAYGFKTFSERWKRMRKQGSKEGLPAIIYDYSDGSTFETKLDKVKLGKKNGVVFTDYTVSKGSRAALASAWGSDIDAAFARTICGIVYATPCPRLGLPRQAAVV